MARAGRGETHPLPHAGEGAQSSGVGHDLRGLAAPVEPGPPRPCEDYRWEWKHCRGLRHAFHHYYAHGELPACDRWRDDYEACRAWERGRAAAAQEALCKSERARVMEKQKYPPVWTFRKSPPPDWYIPLDQDKPS
uniref:Synaptic plasticity regulator PANTS n=1 Tax=Otus sunia TaxID=257818 RepID=A0A8C8BEK6_9STRI